LLTKGGKEIAEECRENLWRWSRSPPAYVVTSGYRLPCTKIAHFAIEHLSQPEKFLPKLEKVFDEAEKLRLSSIALPAIGTGLQVFLCLSNYRKASFQRIKYTRTCITFGKELSHCF